MEKNTVFQNEFIRVFYQSSDMFIHTYKAGFSIEQLNTLLVDFPEIEVTNRGALKYALDDIPASPVKFGVLKDRIIISFSDNDVKAHIVFNLKKEELALENRGNLVKETSMKLKENGVVFGIKGEIFSKELENGVQYLIAEGIYPENGNDSSQKMFNLEVPKPQTAEEGKIDFYDVSLIVTVDANTWLGERIDATDGKFGKTVKGEEIKPTKGHNFPLKYDKKMVREVKEEEKTVLYSKVYGAVFYNDFGEISLMNPLIIKGDVDFKTGNIVFDGCVIVNGTICDGFYLEATGDIEVNGEMGLGNIKGIVSTGGSVFIRGGILSKGGAEIKAAKNIYTKFVDNAALNCGETAHIGFYCLNSTINAKEVILDSNKGQIIGGNIKAVTRVIAPIIGSDLHRRVTIEITGFDRELYKKELAELVERIDSLRKDYDRSKDSISNLIKQVILSKFQQVLYDNNVKRLEEIKEEFKDIGEKKKNYENYLRTRGDGEITATNKIYPNCVFVIKKYTVEITTESYATSFVANKGKFIQV